jgi:TRAP-type C4-dicarboxylate transport system substrate-binding protein
MLIDRRTFIAASIGVALLASTVPAAAATTLNLSELYPEGNFMTQNATVFAAAVRNATQGRVTIDVKAGGALGFKGPEHLHAVADGLVPMADILTSQQQGVEPLLGTETIPFLISNYDDLRALHKVLRPKYDEVAARNNQKILYMVPSPLQYIYLKNEVKDVDGLRGIKIRGADKTTVDIWNSVGMAGVQIPFAELIPALASGRVESVSTSATTGVDSKFWEFMKYIYPTNHTWSCNMVTINTEAWKKLSPEDRQLIEKLARDMEPGFWKVSEKADLDAIEIMKNHGMVVVDIPEPMMKAIRERAASIQEEFLKRVPEARPIVERYLKSIGRE